MDRAKVQHAVLVSTPLIVMICVATFRRGGARAALQACTLALLACWVAGLLRRVLCSLASPHASLAM